MAGNRQSTTMLRSELTGAIAHSYAPPFGFFNRVGPGSRRLLGRLHTGSDSKASNAARHQLPDAPSLPAATRGRQSGCRSKSTGCRHSECNAMTLRGGWVVEFFALAATSRGGVVAIDCSLWQIRSAPLESACHREDRAPQECAPSARWSAILQGPGDERRTRSYCFSPTCWSQPKRKTPPLHRRAAS
jgi:hypothetical protein